MQGYVHKRKDGRWEGKVDLPPGSDGKRRQKSVYANKRAECQRKLNELMFQLESSDFADAGRLTVDCYLEEWFEVYKGKLADTTKLSHKNYIYNHLIPHFKGLKLKDLKPILSKRFITRSERNLGRKPSCRFIAFSPAPSRTQ